MEASTRELDNMLKITGDGRKAALDMRLVEPDVEADVDSKISAARSAASTDVGGRLGTNARPSSSSATFRRPTLTSSTSTTRSATA